eukprot:882549-Ditylum_brightwellii.AAC.1
MDLFKDCQTQFGLDIILRILIKGNGKIQTKPQTLADVQAWSSWFYRGEAQELSVSTDMKIHAIDPNKTGNQGSFLYKDEATGCEYVCGVIFLKMMMEVMKPCLVVDHHAKETELENMTLALFRNNVQALLTMMQEKRNKIDTLQKDGVKFGEQRFLTLIFDRLSIATCIDFKADIKAEKRKWIKDPTL